ncbi:MAG: sigma-70 family RNA polymerase sigma factor [Verrucomicrobia bacterium]|nr:sigma-70 family RNA polymerase sigma factor [Verrucomicrobiota bacterium]
MDTVDPDALDRADMARLAEGHAAALDDLMTRHAARVFQFLHRMVGDEADANDLAQETFVRVFQHCTRFRADARFSTWLYTIAGNLARNRHRWRARHPNVPLDAPGDHGGPSLREALPAAEASPGEAAVNAERSAAVRRAVEALPHDLREAVILCEWQDLPVAEAAAVLHTTPKAVESRLYRARQRLREQLARWL